VALRDELWGNIAESQRLLAQCETTLAELREAVHMSNEILAQSHEALAKAYSKIVQSSVPSKPLFLLVHSLVAERLIDFI
jgi:hypothetical protein